MNRRLLGENSVSHGPLTNSSWSTSSGNWRPAGNMAGLSFSIPGRLNAGSDYRLFDNYLLPRTPLIDAAKPASLVKKKKESDLRF